MRYSLTKTLINKVRPGTFLQGLGRGGSVGASLNLPANAMLGLALGSVGMVLWLKHNGKLKSLTA